MNVQSVVLRRANKLYVPMPSPTTSKLLDLKYPTPSPASPSLSLVATFNLNLQALGYTLSSEALNILVWLSEPTAQKLFDDTLAVLKEVKGARNYQPMYPNFPKQVIEASAAELYINAIIHYWSFVLVDLTGDPDKIWLPKYEKDKREPLNEKVELRVIGVATEKDVALLTTRIATSNTSISATDKEDLKVLVQGGHGNMLEIFPAIKNKENLATLGTLSYGRAIDIAPYFKTATDVLRLATALSNGDVSLKDDSKFRKFKNSERKYLLGLLEKIPNKAEDMLRWRERWVHLGKMLRPGTYAKRFPTTFHAFDALRNHRKIETMRSRIEDVVRNGSAMDAARLLTERPGEFARRLDHVLRQAPHQTMTRVVNAFWAVAEEVSTPVLLQTLAHFEHRQEPGLRVVFPKGNVANVTALDKPLPVIPETVTNLIVRGIKATLVERFSALPKLGKVYIDPALKDCLVPFSQRSASKSLRTLVRGSKLPFGDEKNTLRFFIWWHDAVEGIEGRDEYDSRVDLDLSAVFYDEQWEHTGETTFYNMRNLGRQGYYAVHSGDITSAPNGASEFIDINISEAIADGVRYVVMGVHGYTPQNFCDLPECFAGFMLREHPQSGEAYDPRTVTDKVDLAIAAQDGVPLIIDLVDRKVIWCDAAMKASEYRYHTVAANRGTIQLIGKAFTSIRKPNLYDLFSLHAEARGKLVKDEEKADVVFSVKSGTPFELDRIASEFMTDSVKKAKAASV